MGVSGADDATCALVADIGGTNARFALAALGGNAGDDTVRLQAQMTLAADDYASLQHAAEHYLRQVGARPRLGAVAVACPVAGDEVRLTNRAWAFSRRELRQRLGLATLLVLNDFGAVAWSVPELRADERIVLHGADDAPLQGPVSVVGPGTGLGVALLVGDARSGWQVIETEGGHTTFAPQDGDERALHDWLAARFGRVSNERVLSGAGLSAIDACLRDGARGDHGGGDGMTAPLLRDPAVIVAAALDGHDVLARRALAMFCAILGGAAGDYALAQGARTVAIAGGIVPRFVPFLRSSAFRERFLAKGRFAGYLESVAIQVVMHRHPGLLGAAVALRAQAR